MNCSKVTCKGHVILQARGMDCRPALEQFIFPPAQPTNDWSGEVVSSVSYCHWYSGTGYQDMHSLFFFKKQELLTLASIQFPPPLPCMVGFMLLIFLGFRVVLCFLFVFCLFVLSFVCLCQVSYVPNVVNVSRLFIPECLFGFL